MVAKKSKELREVIQRRKIVAAEIDLDEAVNSIARKHNLTEADVAEVVKNRFDGCFKYVLNKHRRGAL